MNTSEITPLRFPYGIADFAKIQENNYFYVDRTDRIRLIEQAGEHLLERLYGPKLKLRTHAVACIGLERLVW